MEPFGLLFLAFAIIALGSRAATTGGTPSRPGSTGLSDDGPPAGSAPHRHGATDLFDDDFPSATGLGTTSNMGSSLDEDDHCTNPIYSHLPCNIHHDPFDDGIGDSSMDHGIGSIGGGIGSSSLDDGIGGSSIGTGIGSDPFDD